jgi:hypothetical protein
LTCRSTGYRILFDYWHTSTISYPELRLIIYDNKILRVPQGKAAVLWTPKFMGVGESKNLYANHLATKNERESRTQIAMPPTEITAFERMPVNAGASFSFHTVPQNSRKNLRAKTAHCLFGRTSSFSGGTTSKGRKNTWEDFFISQEIESNSREDKSKKLFLKKILGS